VQWFSTLLQSPTCVHVETSLQFSETTVKR